ncbi:hypothetical protein BC939DRAFT_262977 [Gamsiella multidivaricata]|uniref:uncharacterized protein n=1 Tax=Gamsiella multidivaricata TaxID=101098 RepID=UPI00221E5D25|nr:uncharacterized protein BC939DRAFT_262977 [Gamsiella multidivaricata]KAI7819545.1 hypothetical protein BC939DRAFT_262977 [Gamsiella multidivaricata]
MVLENHTGVTWFTPSKITIASPSKPRERSGQSIRQGMSTHEHEHEHGRPRSGLANTSASSPIIPASDGAALLQTCVRDPVTAAPIHHINKSRSNIHNNTSPFLVYGPSFHKLSSGRLRGRGDHFSGRTSGADKHSSVYPYDSALFPASRRRSEDSSSEGSFSGSSSEAGDRYSDDGQDLRTISQHWDDFYYADMPLELLDNIFQQSMYISSQQLSRWAEARRNARHDASKRTMPILFPLQSTKADFDFQQYLGQTNAGEAVQFNGNPQEWQRQYEAYKRAMLCQHLFYTQNVQRSTLGTPSSSSSSSSRSCSISIDPASRLVSGHLTDQDSYDGEDDNEYGDADSDSDAEAALNRSKGLSPAAVGFMLSNMHLNSVGDMDGDLSDSASSGSHDTSYGYQDSSTVGSYTDEDEYEGHLHEGKLVHDSGIATDSDHSTLGGVSLTGAGNIPEDASKMFRHYTSSRPHKMCSCRFGLQNSAAQFPAPRHGINRVVDSELDKAEEDLMIYQVHRDQYFHPTTHTSLHSDLYNCSLVNRQWRIAALQILWQSVVLDAESCRPEPTDPCACYTSPKATRQGFCYMSDLASSSSTAASSSSSSSTRSQSPTLPTSPTAVYTSTRVVRTRLEAMLDSYLDLYGLDLAKCVQTVELDLHLLVWPAECESVKRILRRLSPFTHLRLVWSGDESPEEISTGFKIAMESLHDQIRHLHFFPGFVFSDVWVHEMEKMTRLETLTIEDPESQDAVTYDWKRIRCLRLYSAVPGNFFGYAGMHSASLPTHHSDGTLTTATPNSHATSTLSAMPNIMPLPVGYQGNGWWQWTGLRKIEIRIGSTALPMEWLQDLATIIIQSAAMLDQQQRLDPQLRQTPTSLYPSTISHFGPPLEVLDIDAEISGQHQDIFMDLVQAWGPRFKEFHITHSQQLTDEFFWLCLRKMTQIKKLSLRGSRGITGEGILLDGPSVDSVDQINSTETGSKVAKVPIMWPRDFQELNLDQSRIRDDFFQALKQHCPGVQCKVREVR